MEQAALARQIGVSQQAVSRWENGLAVPREHRLAALAGALHLDVALLARYSGHLPADERSAVSEAFSELYARVVELTDSELVLLIDRAWAEQRRRLGVLPIAPAVLAGRDGGQRRETASVQA